MDSKYWLVGHLLGPRHGVKRRNLDCTKALIMYAIPNCSAEYLQSLLDLSKEAPVQAFDSTITAADADEAGMILDNPDGQEAIEEVVDEQQKRKKSRANPNPPARSEEPPPAQTPDGHAAQASSSSAGSRGNPTAVVRKVSLPMQVSSGLEARRYLPQSLGCTMQLHKTRQWQVKYPAKPLPPKSHSVTYDEVQVTQRQAMLTCLRWAWQVHEALGFDACPHDLTE